MKLSRLNVKNKLWVFFTLILVFLVGCVVFKRKEKFSNFVDENNNKIDINAMEKDEQDMAQKYILPSDCVLELGARYGTVSAVIGRILTDPTKHVAVEPDSTVWDALEKNKTNTNSQFSILKGIISKKKYSIQLSGYGSKQVEDPNSKVAHYTMEQVNALVKNTPFTALVADCEGCMESFLTENENLLSSLRIVIMEEDCVADCNYATIKDKMKKYGFTEKVRQFKDIWRSIWIKQ